MLVRWFESLIDPFGPVDDVMPPRTVGRFYWHYLKQAWPLLATVLVVGLGFALVEVAMFAYIGRIVDMTRSTAAADFFRVHGRELLWMAFVALVLRPVLSALHDLLVNQAVVPGLTGRIRWQQHHYLMRQSLTFFQNDFAGRLSNRVMTTGPSLRDSAVQMVDAVWYVFIYTGSAVALFAQADIRLAVPLVLWIVLYAAVLAYFVPRTRAGSWKSSEARSKLMGRIVDGYGNIMTLKLFAHTQREQEYVAEATREWLGRNQYMTRLTTALDVAVTTLSGLNIVGTTGLAVWLWSQGLLSVGAITVATGLVLRINNISGWFMWVINGIFENIGTVQDGITSISQPRAVQDTPGAPPLVVTAGAIRFQDIHFHYGKQGGVIAGLNLDVRAGEKIGLVGPSGAGKTTLVNLLLRLYDLESGSIRIDGADIAQVGQESLRGQIGMVTQDTSLLHRTIRANLLYGRPEATEEQIREAVRKARADEFIPQLVDGEGRTGYDAYVGERGVKLSGGQRQRIAIARVLLKDAPILVLDEATSALDSEAEAAIQDSLDVLMQGKTVIAIAHRLSTIARMDRLVVMEQGRIIESGTHAELVAQGGLYARLWARQTGGFVAAGDGDAP